MVCHAGNWLDPATLGRHVSALSNGAAYLGLASGRFVWGVSPSTHEVCGTTFEHRLPVDGEPLLVWLARRISPLVSLTFDEHITRGRRIVCLEVARADGSPTAFDGSCHIWLAGHASLLSDHPQVEGYLHARLAHGDAACDRTPLNDVQRSVLEEMRREPQISKARIAKRLGRSVSTVDRAVSFLRSHGYLDRVGANKNGHWVVRA